MLDAYNLCSVDTHKSVRIQRLVQRRGEIFVVAKQGKLMFDNSARIILPNKQIPRVFTTAAKITLIHASSNFDQSIVGIRLVFIDPKISFLNESFIIEKLVFKEMIISQARRQIQSFEGWLYFFSWLQLFFETGGNLFKVRAKMVAKIDTHRTVRSPWFEDVCQQKCQQAGHKGLI